METVKISEERARSELAFGETSNRRVTAPSRPSADPRPHRAETSARSDRRDVVDDDASKPRRGFFSFITGVPEEPYAPKSAPSRRRRLARAVSTFNPSQRIADTADRRAFNPCIRPRVSRPDRARARRPASRSSSLARRRRFKSAATAARAGRSAGLDRHSSTRLARRRARRWTETALVIARTPADKYRVRSVRAMRQKRRRARDSLAPRARPIVRAVRDGICAISAAKPRADGW